MLIKTSLDYFGLDKKEILALLKATDDFTKLTTLPEFHPQIMELLEAAFNKKYASLSSDTDKRFCRIHYDNICYNLTALHALKPLPDDGKLIICDFSVMASGIAEKNSVLLSHQSLESGKNIPSITAFKKLLEKIQAGGRDQFAVFSFLEPDDNIGIPPEPGKSNNLQGYPLVESYCQELEIQRPIIQIFNFLGGDKELIEERFSYLREILGVDESRIIYLGTDAYRLSYILGGTAAKALCVTNESLSFFLNVLSQSLADSNYFNSLFSRPGPFKVFKEDDLSNAVCSSVKSYEDFCERIKCHFSYLPLKCKCDFLKYFLNKCTHSQGTDTYVGIISDLLDDLNYMRQDGKQEVVDDIILNTLKDFENGKFSLNESVIEVLIKKLKSFLPEYQAQERKTRSLKRYGFPLGLIGGLCKIARTSNNPELTRSLLSEYVEYTEQILSLVALPNLQLEILKEYAESHSHSENVGAIYSVLASFLEDEKTLDDFKKALNQLKANAISFTELLMHARTKSIKNEKIMHLLELIVTQKKTSEFGAFLNRFFEGFNLPSARFFTNEPKSRFGLENSKEQQNKERDQGKNKEPRMILLAAIFQAIIRHSDALGANFICKVISELYNVKPAIALDFLRQSKGKNYHDRLIKQCLLLAIKRNRFDSAQTLIKEFKASVDQEVMNCAILNADFDTFKKLYRANPFHGFTLEKLLTEECSDFLYKILFFLDEFIDTIDLRVLTKHAFDLLCILFNEISADSASIQDKVAIAHFLLNLNMAPLDFTQGEKEVLLQKLSLISLDAFPDYVFNDQLNAIRILLGNETMPAEDKLAIDKNNIIDQFKWAVENNRTADVRKLLASEQALIFLKDASEVAQIIEKACFSRNFIMLRWLLQAEPIKCALSDDLVLDLIFRLPRNDTCIINYIMTEFGKVMPSHLGAQDIAKCCDLFKQIYDDDLSEFIEANKGIFSKLVIFAPANRNILRKYIEEDTIEELVSGSVYETHVFSSVESDECAKGLENSVYAFRM